MSAGTAATAEDQAEAQNVIALMAGRHAAHVAVDGWHSSDAGGLRRWRQDMPGKDANPEMRAKPDGLLEVVAAYLMLRIMWR